MKNIKIKQKKSTADKDERAGVVLILALAIVTLMSMLAIAFFSTTETQRVVARGTINRVRAENRAMSGIEAAREAMRSDSKKRIMGEPSLFTNLVYALEGYTLLNNEIEICVNNSDTSGTMFDHNKDKISRSAYALMDNAEKRHVFYELSDSRHPGTPIAMDWDALKTPGFAEMSAATFLLKTDSVNKSYSYGEPFADVGYLDPDRDSEDDEDNDRIKEGTAYNGKFDYEDENGNGIHDEGEISEWDSLTTAENVGCDINGNGAWDDYTSAVRYAADDYWGTFSINVQDTASMIYINGGIVPGDEWRTRVHTQPIVRMLDNLGVILGIFDEDDTFVVSEREWAEEYEFGGNDYGRSVRSSQTWLTPRPHGKGLGRLLIYGDEDSGIDGRPGNGYSSKAEVLGVVEEFARKNPDYAISDHQLALLEQMITTEAWVDPHTVTAGRWFYPEEYKALEKPERWEYAKFEQVDERVFAKGAWRSGVNYIPITANLVAPLIQGRADCDAEPRWYWNEDADDYIKTFGYDYWMDNTDELENPDDPDLIYSVEWYYDSSYKILRPLRWPSRNDENDAIIGWSKRGTDRLDEPYPGIREQDENLDFTYLSAASQRDLESGDKDDDLDDIMGWVAEPRAPININSASRPVIEAMLARLTATYVTDRENNLYPNGDAISDTRNGVQVFMGVPHYPFEFKEFNWDKNTTDAGTFYLNDDREITGQVYWDEYGGWYKWQKFTITVLKSRANPTIMGRVKYLGPDSTPPVVILPEEARRLAAAIVEYREGSDALESDHDLNCNGILDFGDDVDGDGMLRSRDEESRNEDDEYEWLDTNNDGRYQGGVFESWEEFWVFLNMIKYHVFLNFDKYYEDGREDYRFTELMAGRGYEEKKFIGLDYRGYGKELESRFTNLADLKVDLIFANCCPNTDARMFNPNASFSALNRIMPPNPMRWDTGGEDNNGRTYQFARYLKRNISKRDLFDAEGNPTHTTEFSLWPTGMFQVESTGRVMSRNGDIEAECKIRSIIRAFDKMILTTQADFEIGPEDNFSPGDSDDQIASFSDKIGYGANICSKDKIISMPEVDWKQTGLDGNPWLRDWQINVAQAYVPETLVNWFRNRKIVPSYDGQLCLETRYVTDREMLNGQTINSDAKAQLRAYLRFSQMNDHDGHAEFPGNSGSNKVKYNQDELGWRLRTGPSTISAMRIPQLRRDDLDPDEYEIDYEDDEVTIKDAKFRTSPDWADPIYNQDAGPAANNLVYMPSYSNDGILNYYGGSGSGRRHEEDVPLLDENGEPVLDDDGNPEMTIARYVLGGERNRYFIEKRLCEPEAFPVCGEGYIHGNMGYPSPFGFYVSPYEDVEPYDYYEYDYMSGISHPGGINSTLAWPMTVPKYDMEPRLLPDGFYRNGIKWVQWALPRSNIESIATYYMLDEDVEHMVHGQPSGYIGDVYEDYFTSYQMADTSLFTEEEFETVEQYWEYCTIEDILTTEDLACTVIMEFWWKPMYTASWNDNSVWDGNEEDYMKATHNLRGAQWREGLGGNYGGSFYSSDQDFIEIRTGFPYGYFMDAGNLIQLLQEAQGVLDGVNVLHPLDINDTGWDKTRDRDLDGDEDDLDQLLIALGSGRTQFMLENQFHPVEMVRFSLEFREALDSDRYYAYFVQRQRALMLSWGDPGLYSIGFVPHINYSKQLVIDFPYYDEPDRQMSEDYQPDDEDDDAITAYNFNEGEWVHIAIVSGPEQTKFYINGKIPRIFDPKSTMQDWKAECSIEDFEARSRSAGEDGDVEPLTNGLINQIFLPSQNVGTFDEFCYFVIPEFEPNAELVFSAADSLLRERVSDGRYFGHGEWVSPELELPLDARIIGMTWTEFIPRTLFTGEKRDPNEEVNDSNSNIASDIRVSLLDKNEHRVSDHNGRIDLYSPLNNRELFVSMAGSAFDGKFKIKVEMDAYPFDRFVALRNHGFPNEYDFYRTRVLNDTPVLDDITIIYSTGEEIVSWEIVR